MSAHYHPKKPAAPSRPRACMCCRAEFLSTGNHHRLCDDCRVSVEDMSSFEPLYEWGEGLLSGQTVGCTEYRRATGIPAVKV
jgi:hypothetical protein